METTVNVTIKNNDGSVFATYDMGFPGQSLEGVNAFQRKVLAGGLVSSLVELGEERAAAKAAAVLPE